MLRLTHTPPASSSDGQPPIIPSLGGSSASSSAQTQDLPHNQQPLPTSVRGAAPELRRLIRKRQNSESAKRCRQRKKIEDARNADQIVAQAARLQRLESLVGAMYTRLEATRNALATLCARQGICTRCTGAGCSSCSVPPPPPPNTATTPYSPQSVQGADASALAAKVDEIAGWN